MAKKFNHTHYHEGRINDNEMPCRLRPRITLQTHFFSYVWRIFVCHNIRPKHFRFLWFMPFINKGLTTSWSLRDYCLTDYRLPDDCLKPTRWLLDACLTSAWLSDDYLTTAWRLPDDCLDDCLTDYQLPEAFQTTARLSDCCLMTAWRKLDNCQTPVNVIIDY